MLKLSEQQIIDRIHAKELFECEMLDGSFFLKIDSYVPAICTAIHAGSRLRKGLHPKCALSESERYYEEDSYTCQMIQAMPVTLIGNDSRYEYDLNRPIATCIYNKAWGKNVWHAKPGAKDRRKSIDKHQAFYRVLDKLVQSLNEQFGSSVIFDVHSYNYLRRDEPDTPTFNLGTEQLDTDRWQPVINRLLVQLNKIELPNLPVTARENTVFYGRGYMAAHINSRFQNSLVLPLEVKKIYMDELTGEVYPLVMQTLVEQFKNTLIDVSAFFSRRFSRKRYRKKADMLSEKMDPAVITVDRLFFQLARGLETLHYINPINIAVERKKFFKSNGSVSPTFVYRQLDIDPYLFREQLYRLPVAAIRDPGVQKLYRDVIDSYGKKIDLLVKAGEPGFLYESLKYYGEPGAIDNGNAQFILHATEQEAPAPLSVNTELAIAMFREAAEQWGMPCKVEKSSRLAAAAMVLNNKKTVQISANLQMTEREIRALINHELGVHMATTLNASSQQLKVFALGLPGNTYAQEGLAILNEFQSGNFSLKRLKVLALRVLAVREMIRRNDFRHTFSYLHEEHMLSQNQAFNLAVRVHRGGGFTKDHLYLSGVSRALELVKQCSIDNLYIGKTGFEYLDIINELVSRQWVTAPKYYPEYLKQPVESPVELNYLMTCIKPAPSQTGLSERLSLAS
ncbi:flavohemoglobin expression-modulating QEGLA motif protein [Endozoicomonas sp. Mp262]|uniref:flavohemoglobin expression-modulating QEGLA motif protein n=1 Tax=Endozoicomonas sp. Mp262 TaxID=2919499 RepID=UPI0021D8A7A2